MRLRNSAVSQSHRMKTDIKTDRGHAAARLLLIVIPPLGKIINFIAHLVILHWPTSVLRELYSFS